MSIWSDIHKRSLGEQIRKEDFTDVHMEIVLGSPQNASDFYMVPSGIRDKIRYHKLTLNLVTGSTIIDCVKGISIFLFKNENGETVIQPLIDEVKNEYGEFDKTYLNSEGKYVVTDKNKKMLREVHLKTVYHDFVLEKRVNPDETSYEDWLQKEGLAKMLGK